MNENALVWQLEIVNYFVKNYDYKVIKLVDENNQSENNDFWLINKDHKKYSIIRVSNKDLPLTQSELDMIVHYNFEIGSLINNVQETLSIHVVKYDNELEDNVISITDSSYNGTDVSSYFTNFKDILKPIVNPNQDIERITKGLNEYAKSKKSVIFGNSRQIPIVTYSILLICSIFYMLINVFSSSFNNINESFIFFGAYYRIFIMAGDYFRFLTVGLTHGSFLHLAMNMMALYNLGIVLEPIYGHVRFLVILLVSVIGGSALTYILDGAVIVTGISGGLFGLLGALLVYYFHSGIINNPPLRNNIISILMINVFISFLPGIALYGHLGGLLFGVLLGILFTKNFTWKSLHLNTLISLIIICAVMGFKVVTVSKSSLKDVYIRSDDKLIETYRNISLDFYANYLQKELIKIYSYY